MDECLNRFYEFGPFQLDAEERLLLRDGEAVGLTPKAFDLLLALVERPGRLLGKEELLQAVWPDSVVEENNLADNISKLRKALGEGGNGRRFIETVPKRGYRFVALVVAPVEESNNGSVKSVMVESPRTRIAIAAGQESNIDDRPGAPNPVGPKRWREVLTSRRLLALVALIVVGCVFWVIRTAGQMPRSIAVLPFMPLSANDRDEAMELGMAETLISKLSGLHQVTVRPISSVRKYQSLEQDPIAAGRELGVDAVLTATFQRRGERIRVTARLLRVSDGSSLWEFQCNDYCTDIFAAQDAISARVAEKLVRDLTGKEREMLAKRYTENIEAYDLYSEGRKHWNKRNEEGFKKAIEYFQKAIDKDSDYALAYSGLADCYITTGLGTAKENYQKARAAAEKALEIDDSLAEAHTSLAKLKTYVYDWPGAERGFQRALERNPNYPTAHRWYAHYLLEKGLTAEAIAEARRAQELDPTSVAPNLNLGYVLFYARQYDQSIEQHRKTLEMDPNSEGAHCFLGQAYEQKGLVEKAVAEYLIGGIAESFRNMHRGSPENVNALREAYARSGMKGYLRKELDLAKKRARETYVSPSVFALLHARLGEKEQAFAYLEQAYQQEGAPSFLKIDPWFDGLRSDPRFANLLRRIGLEP